MESTEDTKDGSATTIPHDTTDTTVNTAQAPTTDTTGNATDNPATTDTTIATATTSNNTDTNTNTHRIIKTTRKVAKRTPFPTRMPVVLAAVVNVNTVSVAEETETVPETAPTMTTTLKVDDTNTDANKSIKVAPEKEEEGGEIAAVAEETVPTTTTTLPVVDDKNTSPTKTVEGMNSIKVTQEEKGSEESSDDSEKPNATATASPVAATVIVDSTATTPTSTTPTTIPKTPTTTTTTTTPTTNINNNNNKTAVEPHLNDVLFVDDNCQDDSKINKKWPGNRQYRAWIQARWQDFLSASRSAQTVLAKQVIELVIQQDPPGRFLERLSVPVVPVVVENSNNAADAGDNNNGGAPKPKSVWVELDETAVLMELSKALWEGPTEKKVTEKYKRAQDAIKQQGGLTNGDKNNNKNTDTAAATSRQDQQLLLQHAASQYGDYFHTLYITPVYSNSQAPSVNTTASMMQQKQRQQEKESRKQQPRPSLTTGSKKQKRRPSFGQIEDLPDIDNHYDGDDTSIGSNSSSNCDNPNKINSGDKSKRKNSTSAGDNNTNNPNKPKGRKKVAKVSDRRATTGSSNSRGKKEVSPSPVASSEQPAPKKRKTAGTAATTTTVGNADGSGAAKNPYGLKAPAKARRNSTGTLPKPKRKKPEKKATNNNASLEASALGLPRGVTMRPSGKWVRGYRRLCNVFCCVWRYWCERVHFVDGVCNTYVPMIF